MWEAKIIGVSGRIGEVVVMWGFLLGCVGVWVAFKAGYR